MAASWFAIECIQKFDRQISPVGAATPQKTDSSPDVASSPARTCGISYSDVVEELDGRFSFEPYPRCSRRQIQQVQTFWIATLCSDAVDQVVQKRNHCSQRDEYHRRCSSDPHPHPQQGQQPPLILETSAAMIPTTEKDIHAITSSSADANKFIGVVGVVWVPLSGNSVADRRWIRLHSAGICSSPSSPQTTSLPLVEGYLQLVMVNPRYRCRGVARSLLQRCLATAVTAGVSPTAPMQQYSVSRWRLHTMLSGEGPMQPLCRAGKRCRDSSFPDEENTPLLELGGMSCEDATKMMAATIRMYEGLGFHRRRCLVRYYGGCNDAVELVRQC